MKNKKKFILTQWRFKLCGTDPKFHQCKLQQSQGVSSSPEEEIFLFQTSFFLFQTSPTADSFYSGGQWCEEKWEGDIIFQTKGASAACIGNLPDSGRCVGYTAHNGSLSRARAKLLWWIPEREEVGKCETTGKASWGLFPLLVPLISCWIKILWPPLDLIKSKGIGNVHINTCTQPLLLHNW